MPTKVQRQYGIDLQTDQGPSLTQEQNALPCCMPPERPRRGHSTGFPFRDSIVSTISRATTSTRATSSTLLLRDGSNSMDFLRQRYGDSKHSSVTTTASTPLTDLDLSNHELGYNGTPTTGMTTFLPTLHSTPPMPTFQKPDMYSRSSPTFTPTSNITRRNAAHHNNANNNAIEPLHFESSMSTSTPANAGGLAIASQPPILARHRDNSKSENQRPRRIYIPHRSPETPDGYQPAAASGELPSRTFFSRGARAYTTTPLIDRIPDTPPLPVTWNTSLDRMICQFDALGFDHARIVQKVRQRYPQLGGVLTASMIDRRLRQLDQDIDIDCWRDCLRLKEAGEVRSRERVEDVRDKRPAPDSDHENVTREEQEQQDHLTAHQQRQGEQRHQNWSSLYGSDKRGRDDVSSSGMRDSGGGMTLRGSKGRSNEEAKDRPRTVTQDFLGGFRSRYQ